MATNSPAVPWITLRSRTTKHPSSVMLTYAFSFSSSTGKIFTSVMSMAAPRCGEHPLGIGQKSSTTAYPACEQAEVHHADPRVESQPPGQGPTRQDEPRRVALEDHRRGAHRQHLADEEPSRAALVGQPHQRVELLGHAGLQEHMGEDPIHQIE